MAWQDRRYSPWLLTHEERLMRRRDNISKLTMVAGVIVALMEALWPWEQFTPGIPPLVHIGATALILPILYLMLQGDARHKLQLFTHAMDDRARRLFFLDPMLNPDEFEVQERMQGALLRPTQRAIDEVTRLTEPKSLSERVNYYYKAMPSDTLESDRMGWLSMLHPKTAVSWIAAIFLAWTLFPASGITLMGLQIGDSTGLSVLPLLLLVYLFAARANTRNAFEEALYNWLRLG